MRLMPESNQGKISFCSTHVSTWAENAEGIGSSAEEIAALAAKVEAARAAFDAKQRADQAAQSATLAMHAALDEMTTLTASVVLKARAKARLDGDGVYVLAQIPAPAKGSPIAPPGRPESFKAELQQIGAVTLTWKCKNPRGAVGTMYHVRRRIGVGGKFEFLDTVGECRFEDWTIPAGTGEVEYEVRGIRSTAAGPAGQYVLHFGGVDKVFLPAATQLRAA